MQITYYVGYIEDVPITAAAGISRHYQIRRVFCHTCMAKKKNTSQEKTNCRCTMTVFHIVFTH